MLSTTYSRIPKNKLRPRKKSINSTLLSLSNHNSSVYIPPEFYLFTAREKSSNCISTTAPSLIQHRQLQEFQIPNPYSCKWFRESWYKAWRKFLKNKFITTISFRYKNLFIRILLKLDFDQLKAIHSLNYICLFLLSTYCNLISALPCIVVSIFDVYNLLQTMQKQITLWWDCTLRKGLKLVMALQKSF